jgi:hypothetical protein
MVELSVAAASSNVPPTIGFDESNHVSDFHAINYSMALQQADN